MLLTQCSADVTQHPVHGTAVSTNGTVRTPTNTLTEQRARRHRTYQPWIPRLEPACQRLAQGF
jgi:hypothetical protein